MLLLGIFEKFFVNARLLLTTESSMVSYSAAISSAVNPVFSAMTSTGIPACLKFFAIARFSCAAPSLRPLGKPGCVTFGTSLLYAYTFAFFEHIFECHVLPPPFVRIELLYARVDHARQR